MLDLVYVYRSNGDDEELRYSLRSAEKHFPHRNVVIVGDWPDWIKNAKHVETPDVFADIHGGRYKNVLRKIRAACNDDRVSDQFILMNDDFFFLKPVKQIEPVTNGTLAELIELYDEGDDRNQYVNMLKRTQKHLAAQGLLDPLNYAVHYPFVYDKEKCLYMIENVEWTENAMSWRTVYGNMFNVGSSPKEDPKVHSPKQFGEWLETENDHDFLSINNTVAADNRFKFWIEMRFPHKSKYEV